MRALVVNNYTPRNLGDAAIVEGLVHSLRMAGYDHIAVAAIYPDDDWSALGVDQVVPSLFRVGDGSRVSQLLALIRSVGAGVLGWVGVKQSARIALSRSADLVISVGGGYLGAGRVLTNLLAGLNIAYGRVLGKRTIAAPMSIRPTSRLVGFLLRVLLTGTAVFARDRLSQRIFEEARIHARYGSDLALRAPTLGATTRTASGKTIGWAPRTYASDHRTDWSEQEAAKELQRLVDDGYNVVLLTQCTAPSADDRPAVRRAASFLPQAKILPIANTLDEAKRQWASVDVLLGGRMHAAIGAMRVGTPALAVAYEEKVAGLLNDLGLPHAVVHTASGVADRIREMERQPVPKLHGDWSAFDRILQERSHA
jgi:polysaccharide pyruvyl transferase WcaK-like protein